jgi:hypothetical protein
VRYVNEGRHTADLTPLDGDGIVELPIAELRRVTVRRLPPIEGMPDKRPTCPGCGRPLRPDTHSERARIDPANPLSHFTADVTRRTFTGWRGYSIERGNVFDKFCTLGCARTFANAAYRAGYRLKFGP